MSPLLTRDEPARASAATALVVAAALVGLPGCADEPAAPTGPSTLSASDADLARGADFNLVAHHRFADRAFECEVIRTGSYADRAALVDGWSVPKTVSDAEGDESDGVWSDSESATVAFHVREVAPRRARFDLAPFVGEKEVGPLGVELLLNGEPLESLELDRGRERIELDLPAELQVPGRNELGFRFSRALRVSEHVEGSKDYRRLSANVGPIELRVLDDEVAERRNAAARLCAEGSRVMTEGAWRGRAIEQVTGSLLEYFVELPEDPVFVARLGFPRRVDEGSQHARFRVVATPEEGEPRAVLDELVEYQAPSVEVELPLEALGGSVVRLALAVEPAEGLAPVLGEWGSPCIQSTDGIDGAAVSADARKRLERARAELEGAPVVLILLDATNPDFLSAYGGRPGLTPNLDRLAAEGVLFENALSHAAYTIAAVPAVLTSLYTWEHGTWVEETKLPERIPTWTERFRDAGYRTVGIVHSPNGSSVFGCDRGFVEFHEEFRDRGEGRRYPPLAEYALDRLDEVFAAEDDRPLFLWMHIVEPHEPYHPPHPWSDTLDPGYEGDVTGDAQDLWAIRRWEYRPTARDLEHLRAEYSENLAYVDDVVGRVRERLDGEGIFDEAIVAIFSDHGEGFLDHPSGKVLAAMGHGVVAYDEMTRIPLIVRLPEGIGLEGARSSSVVSNLDLLPSVADLTGVEAPAAVLRGVSFAPGLVDAEADPRPHALSHTASIHGKRFMPSVSLRTERCKYIHHSGDRDELFDLESDPGETNNLVDERPIIAGWLRHRVRSSAGIDLIEGGLAVESEATEEFDPELVEQLQKLGYMLDR